MKLQKASIIARKGYQMIGRWRTGLAFLLVGLAALAASYCDAFTRASRKHKLEFIASAETRRTHFCSAQRSNDLSISQDGQQTVPYISRLAVRSFHPTDSRPSSRNYTTRKSEQESAFVGRNGLDQDYNHYRSIALSNTSDRAVSLVTDDVLEYLQSEGYPVQPGDMGENVEIRDLAFHELRVGDRFGFFPGKETDETLSLVEIEITEPIVACANLCKLSYINDEKLTPTERIERCQTFLEKLDQIPGLRGWYAKVLKEGIIFKGDRILRL